MAGPKGDHPFRLRDAREVGTEREFNPFSDVSTAPPLPRRRGVREENPLLPVPGPPEKRGL